MPAFELAKTTTDKAIIKVIGIGGGGGNAIDHMLNSTLNSVDFICANTDAQALVDISTNCNVVQLGNDVTRGLGAGANPDTGREAAIEDREQIMESVKDADMLFITAGMGGGTGTGAAPIVAEVAKELGILTVAVVTKPFLWEGKKRMRIAEQGIEELRQYVDSLIIIPNEKLQSVMSKGITVLDAFKAANNVLLNAVQGIAELITTRGHINVDFADVKTVMQDRGTAMMGIGSAVGENRAREAAEKAISSPLIEDINMTGARGILVNITAGSDLGLEEYYEVGGIIQELADDEATVVSGHVIDDSLGGELRVTIVATGLTEFNQASEIKLIENEAKVESRKSIEDEEIKQLENSMPGQAVVGGDFHTTGYEQRILDIPTFIRNQND